MKQGEKQNHKDASQHGAFRAWVVKVILVLIPIVATGCFYLLARHDDNRRQFQQDNSYQIDLTGEELLQSHQGVLTYSINVYNKGKIDWNSGSNSREFGLWVDGPVGGRVIVITADKSELCDEMRSDPDGFSCFSVLPAVSSGDLVEVSLQLQPLVNGESVVSKSLSVLAGGELSLRVGCVGDSECMLNRSLTIPIRLTPVRLALINNTVEPNPMMDAAKQYAKDQASITFFKAGNYGKTINQPPIIIYSDIPNSDLVLGLRDSLANAAGMSKPPILKSLTEYRTAWDAGLIHHDPDHQKPICDPNLTQWGSDGIIPVGVACQNLDELAKVIVVINY